MKKKISKLALKKTVITVMNNAGGQPQQQGFYGATQPIVSCRIVCIATYNCPTTNTTFP